MSGPRGSMSITPEAAETMSSWRPFASITGPECVRLPGQSKPEPLTGCQPVKLGRRSTRTQPWASGASTRSRVLNATVPTTQSVSSVPKVRSLKVTTAKRENMCLDRTVPLKEEKCHSCKNQGIGLKHNNTLPDN